MTTLDLTEEFRRRLDRKMAARERALPASRRSIRASANAIRAIHRGDLDEAHRLMEVSRTALMEGRDVLAAEPDVYHAGFHQDAQKEYAEARLTEAIVAGFDLPSIDELDVDIAPYLNGMSESIGEGRRAILDLLRRECQLTTQAVIADIGSGTGLLTKLFLNHGNRVFGIEPDPEMRAAATYLLRG